MSGGAAGGTDSDAGWGVNAISNPRGVEVSGLDNTGLGLAYSGPSTAHGAMEVGVDPGLAHAVFGEGRQSFGDKALDALDAAIQFGSAQVFDPEERAKNLMTAAIKAGAGLYGGPPGLMSSVLIGQLLDDDDKVDPLKNSGVSFDPNNTGITTNPNLGTDPGRVGFGVSGTGIETHGKPKGMKISHKELPPSVVPSMEQMLDWNPLQFDTNFNTNITHPALTPEARELDPNAANKVLDAMGVPWGVNPISSISHSDTEREYAERALYSQIANQITQAAGQSGGGTTVAGPTGGSTGGGTTGGGNTGGGTTPPTGDQDVEEVYDPIDTLVKVVLTPKKKLKKLNPSTRKALKKGKKPDYTMMSDYQQDLVRNILKPPKPAVSSNYNSIANR
tara:strand:- start:72 stop:1241 length:1170 start_codon:yes stop_codon:yes gene_type:complete